MFSVPQISSGSRAGWGWVPQHSPSRACRGCRAIPESCILLLCFPDPWELPRHPGAQGALCELSPPSFSSGNTRGFSQALGAPETLQCRTPSSGGSRAQPGLVPQSSARRDPSPAPESQFHPQSHGDHVLKGNKCPNWTMPEGNCSLVAWGRAQLDFTL